jgi:hypothetical protein
MMMVMVMVMMMMVVVVMMLLHRRLFFRRGGPGRRAWIAAGLRRRCGERGASDGGGHKHSHENFVQHFYLPGD